MRVNFHPCRERRSSGRTAVKKDCSIGAQLTAAVACLTLLWLPGPAHAADAVSSVGQLTATPTFESVGLIVPFSGDDNRDIRCRVKYRRAGASDWERGLELWADHRTERRESRELRGSLVHLRPETNYEIEVTVSDPDGGSETRRVETTTWSEEFSESELVEVEDRTTPLEITESGSPSGSRVYRSPNGKTSTIDVGDNRDHNIVISASYVIVRGLDLTGASEHAIVIEEGVHDVVIEDCEITNWGPSGIGTLNDWNWRNGSGIYSEQDTERLIIQNNRIHDPRGGANSWEDGSKPWQDGNHPQGPQAISFNRTTGNHVIRYNDCSSEGDRHYFNDIIGGARNGGKGNLHRDSDVYGNVINHAFDDGLEIEGYNINIRIWGNVITDTMKAIATANIGYNYSEKTDNSLGPQYIWRNLIMNAAPPYESATKIRGNGGYFFYHNTVIDAGQALEAPREDRNTDITHLQQVGTVKNNIFLSGTFRHSEDAKKAAPWWHFDNNLYSKSRDDLDLLQDDWERNGVFGARPTFEVEHEHIYYLAPNDPGVDAGDRIPNFNDRYGGEAPDIGAFERGVFPRADMH